jgi:hypothetical protein
VRREHLRFHGQVEELLALVFVSLRLIRATRADPSEAGIDAVLRHAVAGQAHEADALEGGVDGAGGGLLVGWGAVQELREVNSGDGHWDRLMVVGEIKAEVGGTRMDDVGEQTRPSWRHCG